MAHDDYEVRGRGRDTDLVLAPGEYAYIQDGTKGIISVYVGPQKTSLSQTDFPVNWDPANRVYNRCEQSSAIHPFPSAPEGFYMVLQNPATMGMGKEEHPLSGRVSQHVDLQMGRKINIPGPATFPLWPGQSADAIEGHRLRSNHYLLVRVYNDEEAQRNWDKAVIKPQNTEGQPEGTTDRPREASAVAKPEKLTMGQLIVVKGIDVSFYIPPTGVEVVPDEEHQFVRNAVTLERLEYCILLDESGEKRYVVGPDVVFPKPTETFVVGSGEDSGTRKFQAIELNEIQGIYVKVIAEYEEGGQRFKPGDELFITGKEQAIYYPRPEHSIIRYGDQTKHYAVAIPAGEARYVLDRMSGAVELVRGPKMFLADPRKQVLVRRILSPKEVELWFPGNTEAAEVNTVLRAAAERSGSEFVTARQADELLGERAVRTRGSSRGGMAAAESFQRGTKFTEPRTITLDSKYDGSVRIEVWPGYAILVVSKTGTRRVVIGPETTHLTYDESLLALMLSTGRPKTDDRLIRTVYLKVRNNTVSDVIAAETTDLCAVTIEVSYRVNFTGDNPELWFEVDNYVKFLTDHLRSLLRHAIKQRGIEDFYRNATSVVRDTILGVTREEGEGRPRPGRHFAENGMHVYDVEVLDVKISNPQIASLLVKSQQEAVEIGLKTAALARESTFVLKEEELKRANADAKSTTASHQHQLNMEAVKRQWEADLKQIGNRIKAQIEEIKAQLARQSDLTKINEAELTRKRAQLDQEFSYFSRRLEAESEAIVKQVGAVGDKFSDALVMAAHASLAERVSQDMAPLVALGGGNAEEMFNNLVAGTFLQGLLARTRNGRVPVE